MHTLVASCIHTTAGTSQQKRAQFSDAIKCQNRLTYIATLITTFYIATERQSTPPQDRVNAHAAATRNIKISHPSPCLPIVTQTTTDTDATDLHIATAGLPTLAAHTPRGLTTPLVDRILIRPEAQLLDRPQARPLDPAMAEAEALLVVGKTRPFEQLLH